MPRRTPPRCAAILITTALVLGCGGAPVGPTPASPTTPASVAPPPAGSLYHGVFPGGPSGEEGTITPESLDAYERAAAKTAAWVYFSDEWSKGSAFPLETCRWIRARGAVPFIRLMLRSDTEQFHAEPVFPLERIRSGSLDGELRAWARSAKDFATPILAEYGTEVNGEWFSWNGRWNGREPGAAAFRDAYRHIVALAREEGARNVTWTFHVNDADIPEDDWNTLEAYYPGDEWVDWLAVSVYGAQTVHDDWREFRPAMDLVYPRLARLSATKPIVLLEFGVTAGHDFGDQAAWADAALVDVVGGRWPRVVGFSWWNEAWENEDGTPTEMRVQRSAELSQVFARRVGGDPRVLGRVTIDR